MAEKVDEFFSNQKYIRECDWLTGRIFCAFGSIILMKQHMFPYIYHKFLL